MNLIDIDVAAMSFKSLRVPPLDAPDKKGVVSKTRGQVHRSVLTVSSSMTAFLLVI